MKLYEHKPLVFLLFYLSFMIFSCQNLLSQINPTLLNSLSAHFMREEFENNKLSITKGVIYFKTPNQVWIQVNEPVIQNIKIDSDKMSIFYPINNKLFNFTSKSSFSLSFLTPFIASLESDYGLSKLKYQLNNYKFEKDTLTSSWYPHPKADKRLGKVIVKTVSDKIIQVIKLDKSGKKKIEWITFEKYLIINDIFSFPELITIYKNSSENQFSERIYLEEIKINHSIPNSITNFTIPDNVIVEDFAW